ncbi:acyl carrier protein [Kitasatospora sp. NPDC088134]|uniref:acyl carrier protein n=1 Tax=Kitasatospora sp. NPDC088134 TaxID=3364071 RepID=UPI0038281242
MDVRPQQARRAGFDRAEALAMLARYGDRSPEQVDEHLGSLELTWLIAEAEQAYQVQLDLEDDRLDAIRTVDDAVAALGAQIAAQLDAQLTAQHTAHRPGVPDPGAAAP